MVDLFSYGLLAMGFKKGDKIVSISNNRPEWNFMDMGMSQIGCVHVPVYANLGHNEYKHILTHSDARLIMLSYQEFYDKIKDPAAESKNIEGIYSFDPIDGVNSWMDIINLGKENEETYKDVLTKIKDGIEPDDLLSIIYTSGSTKFGDTQDDRHSFTGSVEISGSATIGTFIGATHAINGTVLISGSSNITDDFGVSGSLSVSGSSIFQLTGSNAVTVDSGYIILSEVSQSLNFADDTAAAAGGIPLGGLYRNGNFIQIRVS